jgi:hypothetical protein
MQAIKYAAMASRFTAETLAAQHAEYLSRRGAPVSVEAARELLEAHSDYELLPENLAKPRIVLLATSFPPIVTATAVWLSEMSLDMSLIRLQAYRAEEKIVVSVSQLFPVPDVEDFMVAPARSSKSASEESNVLPELPWTTDELRQLRGLAGPTVLAALDLCSNEPGEWIPLRRIEEQAGREHAQARADLAVLTMTVKRRFGRSNWPFNNEWAAGGEPQSYYRMDHALAALWRNLSESGSNVGEGDPALR